MLRLIAVALISRGVRACGGSRGDAGLDSRSEWHPCSARKRQERLRHRGSAERVFDNEQL